MSPSAHRYFRGVNWRELPLFRFSFPFIAGIILYAPERFEWAAVAAVAVLLGARYIRAPAIARHRIALTTWSAFFALGLIVQWCADRANDPHNIANQPSYALYTGTVKEAEPYSKGTRATITLRFGMLHDSAHVVSGKVLAYLQHPADSLGPLPGDTVVFGRTPDTIPHVRNPFQWDPGKYYGDQQIFHRLFLAPGQYRVCKARGFSLARVSHRFRGDLQSHLRTLIPDTAALAVLNAMLLGDKSLVSDDLRTAYVKSGIIHILAISGLHIGIVAAILILLIGRPKPEQGAFWSLLRSLAILSGIWGFTLISGMSPSATRAALMCTIATIGITWHRRSRPLNILGCAAITVLVIDPSIVYSISFQFSFLALLGILVFATPLFRLVVVRQRLIKYAWGIIGVSIAAQVPIAPAMLYYFGEMSTLSPITSIVAIPAAFLIVAGGIATITMSYLLPGVAEVLAGALSAVIRALNAFATAASGLSFSAVEILIDEVVLVSFYIFISCLVMRFLTDRSFWVTISLIPVTATAICSFQHLHATLSTPALAIFPGSEAWIEVYHHGISQTSVRETHMSSFDRMALYSARRMHHAHRILADTCAEDSTLYRVHMPSGDLVVVRERPPPDSAYARQLEHLQLVYILEMPDSASLDHLLTAGVERVVAGKNIWSDQRALLQRMCFRKKIAFHDIRSHGAFYSKLHE